MDDVPVLFVFVLTASPCVIVVEIEETCFRVNIPREYYLDREGEK
jgi:hypothetical protein